MGFIKSLQQAVKQFTQTEHTSVRIISCISPDGIASSSILAKAFQRAGITFTLSFIAALSDDVLNDLRQEQSTCAIFLDIGAAHIASIEQHLDTKTTFILDHHQPQTFEEHHTVHLNPYLFGLDGTKDISTAGITYLFAKELDELNTDLAHLALIGAVADHQDKAGFVQFNKTILDDALLSKKIIITEGFKLHNLYTQPLHKTLQESIDPYLPPITGSEYEALRFFEEQHISITSGNTYKMFQDFTDEHIQKIISALIMHPDNAVHKPEDIYGPTYLTTPAQPEPALRTLREYAHVLHACTILNTPS